MGDVKEKDDENITDQDGKDTAGESNNTNQQNDNSDDKKQEKTFSQRQVSAMMTNEKKQGKASAYREMGINPDDSKMIAMVKAFIEAQKSDEQKVDEQLAANAAEIAKAEQRANLAEAKAELMVLGCNPNYVDDAVSLVLSKVDENTDIKSVVTELKAKYSIWFGGNDNSDQGDNPGQRGTGSSVNASNSNNSGKDAKGIGQRLAAQRRVGQPKSSFWK